MDLYSLLGGFVSAAEYTRARVAWLCRILSLAAIHALHGRTLPILFLFLRLLLTQHTPSQHFDAFNLDEDDGRRFASNGGQRTITVLVYLNDVQHGGCTHFPRVNLNVQPKQGMALVFFPATIHGVKDEMALHSALPAVDTKYVSQIWIRQQSYFGQASKRLVQKMGAELAPFDMMKRPPLKIEEAFPPQA